jgi:general secretion pathway protein L
LPEGREGRDPRILCNAIEEALIPGVEDIHAIPVSRQRDGRTLVAAVDRTWLKAAFDALCARGLTPERMIVESELLSGSDEALWTVVRTTGGGFAHIGGCASIALDGTAQAGPRDVPLTLRLLMDEHRSAGNPPREIALYSGQASLVPDQHAWSAALGVQVNHAGPWQPQVLDARDARDTDLLAGAQLARAGSSIPFARYRLAAAVLLALLLTHLGLSGADWFRLHSEAAALRSGMENRFRALFPQAKSVADPSLQLARNLQEIRRAAGEVDSGDFIALFARVAPQLSAAGAQARSAKYDRGQLNLELSLASQQALESLSESLRGAGIKFMVEHVSTGPTGSALATVRVTPGPS